MRPRFRECFVAVCPEPDSVVSVVYGILLVIAPLIGALTLWLGAYTLVFGIALLVLAFLL